MPSFKDISLLIKPMPDDPEAYTVQYDVLEAPRDGAERAQTYVLPDQDTVLALLHDLGKEWHDLQGPMVLLHVSVDAMQAVMTKYAVPRRRAAGA